MQCDAGILKSPENGGNGRIVQNYIAVYLKKSSTSDSTAPQSNVCPYKEPSTLVKYGMRGDGCKWVQWQLNRVMNSGLVVDGIFGNASVTALKNFQRNKGLAVDGLCGQATRNALKSA